MFFSITSSIGTPICINFAFNKSAFERLFGHFVRVLVNLDLANEFVYKLLVERVGYAFFVDIEYENVHEFCLFFSCIGHNISFCKRKELSLKGVAGEKKISKGTDAKGKRVIDAIDLENYDDGKQCKETELDKIGQI